MKRGIGRIEVVNYGMSHHALTVTMGIKYVADIRATLKFISFEPLCDRIDIQPDQLVDAGIGWVILGRETPIPKVHLPWQWFSEVVEAADKARIPVFLKENLSSLLQYDCGCGDAHYREWARNKDGTRSLRQEFPNADTWIL